MGIRERKQRDYENREKLILATAKRLVSEKGFPNVTVEDIASEIEFSKGTIYSHFESKEEIHARVLLTQLHQLQAQLKAAAESGADFDQGLRLSLEAYLRFYNEHREYFQLLFFVDVFSHQYRIPEKLRKEIQFQKIACLSPLQKLIILGMAGRKPADRRRAKRISLVLWGMLNGLLQLVESRHIQPADLDGLIQVAYEIVTDGLMKNH